MAKLFDLIRESDSSGISGTGKVGEGVVFEDGTTVFRWSVHHAPKSTVVYTTWGDFLAISITAHPTNRSRIEYSNGEIENYGPNNG